MKGWRTPLCGCGCNKPAIYVGRPSKWGNNITVNYTGLHIVTHSMAVDEYIKQLKWMRKRNPNLLAELRDELAGHDLMCWCRLDQPCHADILLQIANQKRERQ